MGGKEVAPLTISDYFNELFTYALSLGMSYDLYWYGDPFALLNYIKADEIKLRKINQQLWLQGFYVYQAVGSLVPVLNPFSKEHKPRPYLQKPIPITQQEIDEEEQARIDRITRKLDSLVGKKLR